jgi:hypothetical protein
MSEVRMRLIERNETDEIPKPRQEPEKSASEDAIGYENINRWKIIVVLSNGAQIKD